MNKRIRQKLKEMIPLNELKEKRRKKADHDKENYHKFYARSVVPPDEWAAMQAKKKRT